MPPRRRKSVAEALPIDAQIVDEPSAIRRRVVALGAESGKELVQIR